MAQIIITLVGFVVDQCGPSVHLSSNLELEDLAILQVPSLGQNKLLPMQPVTKIHSMRASPATVSHVSGVNPKLDKQGSPNLPHEYHKQHYQSGPWEYL